MKDRLLRRADVQELVGISTSTLYRWMDERDFPPGVMIGPNARRWWLSEVEAWIDEQADYNAEDMNAVQ